MRHTCIIRNFLVNTPCQQLCACIHSREKTEYILSERCLVKKYGFALSLHSGGGDGSRGSSSPAHLTSCNFTATSNGLTFMKFDLVD